MVKKVKCKDSLGLNVKNVEDEDVNITAGSESVVSFNAGLVSESRLLGGVASNSSKIRASRCPLEGDGLPAASRLFTSSICLSNKVTKPFRLSLAPNSKNNSSCPL